MSDSRIENVVNKKTKIMNLENQLLEKFQVEELEKRYELKISSWVDSVTVGYQDPTSGGGVAVTINHAP